MESIIYSVKIAWKWSPVEAGKSEQDNINGEREYVDEMPIQPSHWNPDCPCPTCTQIPPEKNELFEIPPSYHPSSGNNRVITNTNVAYTH